MPRPPIYLLLLLLLPSLSLCGHVLFWMPFSTPSMKITIQPIANELNAHGHKVTLVTPHAKPDLKAELVRDIVVESGFTEMYTRVSESKYGNSKSAAPPIFDMVRESSSTNDNALGHPMVKELYNSSDKVDVVVVSAFFGNEAGYYIAHKLNAQIALYFTGQNSLPWMDSAFGQPHNPALVPFFTAPFEAGNMNFMQRTANTVITMLAQHVFRNWYALGQVNSLLDKHFPDDGPRPDLLTLEHNAAVGFMFGHALLLDGFKPTAPNFVQLGMMNCRPAVELPKDLKEFVQSKEAEKHGVVYVNFGSVMKSSMMSKETRELFTNVFARLPQRVLWKWETDTMEGKPDNVMLSKWLPQQDVLGHNNVKLFISHSGQSSHQETLCHKTPVISLPVNADQPAIAREVVRIGMGKAIPFAELTEEWLFEAITDIVADSSYGENAAAFGSLLLDQETSPLSRAVWWLEYTIRHPDAGARFKSPGHSLTTSQIYLLDVMVFLAVIGMLLLLLSWKLLGCLCRAGYRRVISESTAAKTKAE